jgi:hypothetical protein
VSAAIAETFFIGFPLSVLVGLVDEARHPVPLALWSLPAASLTLVENR